MILGIVIGLLMPDWRGVAFASLAAIPIRIGWFVMSGGELAPDVPAWASYAAMSVTAYAVCLIVGSITYAIKRAVRQRA